jgi:hypothetical protein
MLTVGRFDGAVYTNPFFGLTIAFPEDWTILTRKQMAELMKLGQDMIGEYREDLADSMKLSQEKTIYCFIVFGKNDSNVNMVCTNLKVSGLAATDPETFLKYAKIGLQSQSLPFTFGDITALKIAGKDFAMMTGEFEVNGVKGLQRYYCAIQKGYAMMLTLSATSQADMDALAGVVAAMDIK